MWAGILQTGRESYLNPLTLCLEHLMRVPSLLLAASLLGACSATTSTDPGAATSNAGSNAAAARIRCEVRGTARSRISVDGNNLTPRNGSFSARVSSGANSAAAPVQAAVGDEAEFDFDSSPANIRAGATPISRTFIQGGSVTAEILDASGAVVASGSAACRVR